MENITLTKSQENYLIAIYSVAKNKNYVRVKDISEILKIGASSVSEGIKFLADKNLIDHTPHNYITITQDGINVAKKLEKRTEIIQNFLVTFLKFSKEESTKHTKKIEYAIDGEVLRRLTTYLEFSQLCKCKKPKWLVKFHEFTLTGKVPENCTMCLECCKCGS